MTDVRLTRISDDRNWTPVLSGNAVHQANDAIRSVAEHVSSTISSGLPASQLSDIALLFGYLSQAYDSETYAVRAVECLNLASDRLETAYRRYALYGGITGVAWTMQHVRHLLQLTDDSEPQSDTDSQDDDPLAEVDELLVKALARPDWTEHYDLISGLVGICLYLIERMPSRIAAEGLTLVLEQFEKTALHVQSGVTWRTPPEHVAPRFRATHLTGHYDLGVAHGVPGIISALTQMMRLGIEPLRTSKLLTGAVRWLVSEERPSSCISRYGSYIVEGEASEDSRLGWCYGDLGIAAVLLDAGISLESPKLQRTALDLMDRCICWPDEHSSVHDAPLCHGALGIAHIFNRTYHRFPDSKYKSAAIKWYERGLELRSPNSRVAGFFAWRPDLTPSIRPDESFLSGAIGCALALLASVTPQEPNWDRLMLLSSRASILV
jgi:lantibiotic biosynthesis protein